METVGLMANGLVDDINRAIRDDLAHTELHSMAIMSIYVLASLYEKDGQGATELAKSLGVASTSFTPTLDRLENAQLVSRAPRPSDRRAIIVSLTRRGKELQHAVLQAIGNAEVKYKDVFAPKSNWLKERSA